jgi:hypothetical protein
MLVTRLVDIVKTAIRVKILLSKEISFALITLIAMLLIKRFKATYNYTIRLAKEIMKVGTG